MRPTSSLRRTHPLLVAVLLAIGYYLTGKLALLMAIPPGYATPVWPGAGLALAALLVFGYRIWPGIALGSFWINFPTALASAGGELQVAVLVAAVLALGAALQALVGALLVRRYVDQQTAYARADQIGLLLLLGGPLACLASATVGLATLWAAGVVSTADIGFNWFTWWVGDSIGVVVVMPIFLAWEATTDLLPRRKKVVATLPTLVLLALVTSVFLRTSALEQQRIRNAFEQRSDRVAHALELRFAGYTEVLHAVANFQTATVADTDRVEFQRLVADMLARHPGLYALSWSPRVPAAQREAHEQSVQGEGFARFRIRERDIHGALVPAGDRAEYFPITYIEPLARNASALGFDLASEPNRLAMLLEARNTGEPAALGQVDLVQTPSGQPGVLVVAPAYRPALLYATPEQRRDALRGYASAVFLVDEMMTRFLKGLAVQGMQLRLEDAGAPPARRLLFAHLPPTAGVSDADLARPPHAPALIRTANLQVGGRPWRLVSSLTPDPAGDHRSWAAWSVLIAGLLFTCLFSTLLLVIVGRAAAVKLEVRQRTAELNMANAASLEMAQEMAHLAQHDHLTDLPNRVMLQDRLAQAIAHATREQGHMALLYSDLDGFKNINDSLGHEVGDLLLQQVAQRLLEGVRAVDTVSRQGGDEFVILLPEVRGSADAARVADNILHAMRRPFHVGNAELNVTLSIGISLFPDDGSDPGVLFKYADAAMYQAKQHGRNQYRFYTRAISERADRRLSIERSLHQALRNDEFVLHYQPKVQPGSGAITGMEALVRWQSPSGELCFPDEFIGIAEECGLISRIDQWVLEEACRQNHAWQQAGLARVAVAVNLSAAHTHAERYPELLAAVLARTGLAAEFLQIEITESQMLRDTARFETLIRGIKAVGVKVAIDDFGTGYSSLGYLCQFSFDVLKIDRTFVRTLEVDSKEIAVVEAITRLARRLDYVVVAEGVETLAQARILQAHGCHEMQGYLYSRPVPAAQFEALLRRGSIVPEVDASTA